MHQHVVTDHAPDSRRMVTCCLQCGAARVLGGCRRLEAACRHCGGPVDARVYQGRHEATRALRRTRDAAWLSRTHWQPIALYPSQTDQTLARLRGVHQHAAR